MRSLGAVEPLTGRRLAAVYPQRTKKEYAQFCQSILARWPEAQRIRLVQDNLNTHNASAFYEHLPADEAFAMTEKFEFIYTHKSASWLNMIEIEFSAIARACLTGAFQLSTSSQLKSWLLSANEMPSASSSTGNSPYLPP